MSVRLFVGNLPYDATETDLREFFSAIGSLSSVIIPTDRETGKPRGFAFVEFNDPAQAEEACRQLNNKLFGGRAIAINKARAKESRHNAGPVGKSGHPMKSYGADHGWFPGPARKPSMDSGDFDPNPMKSERASRAGKRSRYFAPNGKPARKRKSRYDTRDEAGWKKGPIRIRVGGQFFGSYEDDLYEDDREQDFMAGFRDKDEEGTG